MSTRPDTVRRATPPRRRRLGSLSVADRWTVALMVLVPTLLVTVLVWVPALASVALSFTNWDGFGPVTDADLVGGRWYRDAVTIYPAFWPAVWHNVIWLAVLVLLATPLGMFLAVLIDREVAHTRFYQTSLYLPVMLSMALVGFIWQLMFSRDQGLINAVLGTTIDWYGDPDINLYSALIATSWRHVGYVMLLYLAGLKGLDPALHEAAMIDGAGEVQTFFHVTLPALMPVNIIVLVVTFIDSLRAFDLVWVINRGRNGLELLATEVTRNIVGEAQRIGFGSALATILLLISSLFVVMYVRITLKEEEQ